MIYVKPAKSAGISSTANGALTLLSGQHFRISSVFDTVLPARIIIGVAFGVFVSPVLTRPTMRRGVFVPRGSNRRDAARLALPLFPVVCGPVGAERIKRFYLLASGAVLGSFGRFPTRGGDMPGLGIGDLTLTAIARQTVRAFDRLVKRFGGFNLVALRTGLHNFLLLRKRIIKTTVVSVNKQTITSYRGAPVLRGGKHRAA